MITPIVIAVVVSFAVGFFAGAAVQLRMHGYRGQPTPPNEP